MKPNTIHEFQTEKEMEDIIRIIEQKMNEKGLLFDKNCSLDMRKIYTDHNIDLPADFNVQMIRVCSPERSSKALFKNPERACVTPRFLTFFRKNNKTQIRFPALSEDQVTAFLNEPKFSKSFAQTNHTIVEIVNNSLV